MCYLLAPALSLVLAVAAAAQQVVWDRSSPGVLRRGIVVPEEAFSRENVIALARHLLDEHRGADYIHLQIAVDERQVNPFPRMSELTFEEWLRFQHMLDQQHWRVADLTALDGRAVLRFRDGGSVWREVLEGNSDPLLWKVEGTQFEVLHVAFHEFPGLPSFHEARVFVRSSGPVEKETCRRLFHMLKERLPRRLKGLTVQNNAWFVTSDKFPMYYWFETALLPTKAQYEATWRGMCLDEEGDPLCLCAINR